MLGKLIANTFQEALILLRLFLDRGLGHCYACLIFNGERAFCNSFVSFRPILNFRMPDIQ